MKTIMFKFGRNFFQKWHNYEFKAEAVITMLLIVNKVLGLHSDVGHYWALLADQKTKIQFPSHFLSLDKRSTDLWSTAWLWSTDNKYYSIDNKSRALMTYHCGEYCNEMSWFSCEISVFYSLWKILKRFLLFQISFMRQWLQLFIPYIENSLISNSLISKGLNIMSPIGTAGAPKICPLYRISLRSRVTISRVDCILKNNLFLAWVLNLVSRSSSLWQPWSIN